MQLLSLVSTSMATTLGFILIAAAWDSATPLSLLCFPSQHNNELRFFLFSYLFPPKAFLVLLQTKGLKSLEFSRKSG